MVATYFTVPGFGQDIVEPSAIRLLYAISAAIPDHEILAFLTDLIWILADDPLETSRAMSLKEILEIPESIQFVFGLSSSTVGLDGIDGCCCKTPCFVGVLFRISMSNEDLLSLPPT